MPLNARLHPREHPHGPDGARIRIDGRELDEHPATIRGDGRTVGSFVRLTGRPTKARGTPPRREPQDGDRTGSGRGV